MGLIRNAKRNIAVSSSHSYTVEKVKKAMDFVNASGRLTTPQQWVDVYNEIKGTDEKLTGCKSCAIAKFTAGVRNYAKMGYLVLLNEGHTPQEFGIGVEEEKVEIPIENEENRIQGVIDKVEEIQDEVKETVDETPVEDTKEDVKEETVEEEVKEETDVKEEKPRKKGRKNKDGKVEDKQ